VSRVDFSQRSFRIQVTQCDAASYAFEPDDMVVFLFNPFDSSIMNEVLNNLKKSLREHPRPLALIFNNFHYSELFEKKSMFRRTEQFAYGGTEITVFESI
jgi:hypothetical protein